MKRAHIAALIACLMLMQLGCSNDPAPQPEKEKTAASSETSSADNNAAKTSSEKQDAEEVLKQSIASAKKLDKNVFVHIGAPW